MANAKPVHSKPAVVETAEEAKVETPVVPRNDPRRPNSEPEAPITKPKTVTVLENGTVIEDY